MMGEIAAGALTPHPRARWSAIGGIEFPISPSRPFGPPADDENTGICGDRWRLSKSHFRSSLAALGLSAYASCMASSHREQMKKEYGDLFRAVSAVLFETDPMSIAGADNTDEYEPEVSTVLPRLKECHSEDDVHRVLLEEFTEWFGSRNVGPGKLYVEPAAQIWRLWQARELNKRRP